jgi:DNA polymerase I-like protein with 3'-5' exonuclease and polymerase domains
VIFDIETNGFLDTVTKVHCIAYCDEAGGVVQSVGGRTDEGIRAFLSHLEDAPVLIGHNIIEFDLAVLRKVYPAFKPRGQAWDTLLDSQWMFTDLLDLDYQTKRKNADFPAKIIGRHSLKAWGYRLGVLKGEFGELTDWAEWSKEMQDYCMQDVIVNRKLYDTLRNSPRWCQAAHDMEMEFKQYMLDQEREGCPFNETKAKEIYAELAAERATLEASLSTAFKPWTQTTDFIPKRNNSAKGYVAGEVFKKTKEVTFNPRSHQHIADRLIAERGWQPEAFTETGQAETDSEVLEALGRKWPECKTLARHSEIQKAIGMIAEGKSAYLKMVAPDGRLRGKVNTCSTVTGRCSHKEPNLGNVPRKGELGKKIRTLFTAVPGCSLVGGDAKGLELRCMGHFLAPIDGGAYAKIVIEGDPHEFHRVLADLESRDDSKTFIYGFIYGAGDAKIGLIIHKGQSAGRALRHKFLKRFPALDRLKAAVASKARTHGYIHGLDGRRIHVRAVYSSLNTLLQSAGALVMKWAVIHFNREIRARGWYQEHSVRQVAFVHDEIQALVLNGYEERVQTLMCESIREGGKHFNFRLPTDGDSKKGGTWNDTH